MEISAVDKAGLVTRSVETIELDGKPAKVIVAARDYPTSVDDLWDAVTNPQRIPRWFAPITGVLELGGRYQLEGNAGGEVLECEPPRRFRITWEYGGDTSWVTVEITGDAAGDGSHLELRHVAHVPEEFWDSYGPGAVGVGWDLGLVGLDLHVAAGETVDPEAVRAWEATPDAAAFKVATSSAWAEASIADGTDPGVARARAERVTAFYTSTEEGEGPEG